MTSAVMAEVDESGAHAIKRSERGAEAFARARRHSRLVRVLKFVLPGAAIVITALFLGYSLLSSAGWGGVDLGLTSIENGELVMRNPSLDGYTSENLPYSMTAERARQAVGDENGAIRLEGIQASLPLDETDRATLTARSGVFDRQKDRLTLSEGITMTTTSGIVARLQSAEVDIGANVLSSDEPVQIEMEGMRLRADTFRASDGGNKLIFENRVRMELDPATIRQNREEESGNDE